MPEEDEARKAAERQKVIERQNRTFFLKSLVAGRLSNLTQNIDPEMSALPLHFMTIKKFFLDQTPKEQGMEIGFFLTRSPIYDHEVIEGDDMSIFYGIAYDLARFDGKNIDTPSKISSYRQNLSERARAHDNKIPITNNEVLWLRIIDVLDFIKNNPQGENKNSANYPSESPGLG